jgi:hypothetical protein
MESTSLCSSTSASSEMGDDGMSSLVLWSERRYVRLPLRRRPVREGRFSETPHLPERPLAGRKFRCWSTDSLLSARIGDPRLSDRLVPSLPLLQSDLTFLLNR